MQKTYIDKLALIYIKDHKILMSLTKGLETWYVPGGKREPGESDHQALIREVKEELAVDLIPDSIKPYGVFEAIAHNKPAGTYVRMTCYTATFTGTATAFSEIDKIAFFSYAQKRQGSFVDVLIFDDLHTKGLLY